MQRYGHATAATRLSARPLRAAAGGHAWGFLLHGAAAVCAGACGNWVVFLVSFTMGVFGHFYPTMLQKNTC